MNGHNLTSDTSDADTTAKFGERVESDRFVRNPVTLWREVSRGAVLSLAEGEVVRISHSGLAVWKCLETACSVAELTSSVAAQFSVDSINLADDIERTVAKFRELGVVNSVG